MNEKQSIDLVFQGLQSTGNLYIGNYSAATNFSTLKNLNIQAVVTAAKGLLLSYSKSQMPNYLYLPIEDTESQQITKYFEMVNQFIDKNRSRTNILIHCYSGISRSAAFTIAYLIKRYEYCFLECLRLLRKKRPRINPNKSFVKQLESYHSQIRNSTDNVWGNNPNKTKSKLMDELNDIKELRKSIETKISEAKEKLEDGHKRKRSSSEYLKQRLQERRAESCRSNNDRKKKFNFDLQILKGIPLSVNKSNMDKISK